jgi:acetoin utilization deacetylase AcuC-like enzyme
MSATTGIVLDDRYIDHLLGFDHPESPQRLRAVKARLEASGLLRNLVRIPPNEDKRVALEAVLRVHNDQHAESITGFEKTSQIPLLAVGGAIAAVDAVMQGTVTNAFCALRPPGHHSHNNGAHFDGRGQGEGFCFFNNVAIAARYAQKAHGCGNVLILDWDFHHGNGTEWTFYEDPSVSFFSTHALFAYPGTGSEDRTGAGDGEGYNLNVALPPGAGDDDIVAAWEDNLLPQLQHLSFKPDIVLISAGFDSREEDFLGSFHITDQGFVRLTKIAMDIARSSCNGRLVSVLEGGYNPEGLASAVERHVRALTSEASEQ